MATIETRVSDISGNTDNVETHTFSVDSNSYEIDLTSAEFAKLEKALATYVENARRARTSRRGRAAGTSSGKNAAMREWLVANGYQVSARGRISKDLEAAYDSRTPAK